MKITNKKCKILISIIIAIILMFVVFQIPTFADVGDFESYDSGWDSSSWDSGSSWSSSSWDYGYDDWDYDSGFNNRIYIGSFGGFASIIFTIVIFVILYLVFSGKFGKGTNSYNAPMNSYRTPGLSEDQIVSAIKAKDENFSKDGFLSWARDLFVKLQYAWSDRDWETIRCFETPELFEQHRAQLQRYIDNKQINKMERISVNSARLFDYKEEADKEVLSVLLSTKMIDYIIDEQSGRLLKGSKTENRYNTYKLTFVRKAGVKTVLGTTEVNTTNCPNCGAPTEITSAGKCSYCGSVITTGDFNWVLSNLEPYRG